MDKSRENKAKKSLRNRVSLGKWFPILLLILMTGAAVVAGVRAAGITTGKRQEAGLTPAQEENRQENMEDDGHITSEKEDIYAEGNKAVGVLREIDEKTQTITVYQIAKKEEVTFSYTGATEVISRYGSTAMSIRQLSPGLIVYTVCEAGGEKLLRIQEDESGWTYKGASDVEIDRVNESITIAGRKYQLDRGITVVNQGELVELDSVAPLDILTVRGVDNRVYSLEVSVGHGELQFANFSEFVGGSIEIGYDVFDQIHEGMEYTLREGSYKLVMRNQGRSVNKYITIERDKVFLMDLLEYREEIGRTGLVSFYLEPEEAEVYLDDRVVDVSLPLELGYGEYVLRVSCEGYESCERLLTVSAATQSIRIDLAGSKAETDGGYLGDLSTNPENGWEDSDNDDLDSDINTGSDIIELEDWDTSGEMGDPEENQTESSGNVVMTEQYIMISKPVGASVYFDGNYIGVAPVQTTKVTGEHQITFKQDGYISKTYTIDVEHDAENPIFSFPALTRE